MSTSHAGRFVWRELITPSPAQASEFYSGLMGWTAKEVPMGGPTPYTLFHHDGLNQDTGGAMTPQMEGGHPAWIDYITVENVDASFDHVKELGGQQLVPPFDVPNIGRMAWALDPTGAVFALFQGLGGDAPPEDRPSVGTFCWSQINTTDLKRAVDFYTRLFGWTAEPMGPDTVVFKSGETMRASAMTIPAGAPAPSHWIQYLAVDDADASFARAKQLGAQAFVPPTTMEGMGRFAVLADPTGAMFALWKDLSAQG